MPAFPNVVPLPPLSRGPEVADLLVGAVDLHCHSGPAAMPRVLDHHDELLDAAAAGFRAVVYKDHYYAGMAHAAILEKLFPESGVTLRSGIVLNNASGGINPHAVDHTLRLGGVIVWMPTLSAANHLDAVASGKAGTFPATKQKMLPPVPLRATGADGRLTDAVLAVLDLIAEANVILAGGHLHVREQHLLFAEAKRRGVRKMLVNHPTYIVDFGDEDIRQLAAQGVMMEHSICMFVDGRSRKFSPADLAHLIGLAGADRTILSSDLGLLYSMRPVDGYRNIVQILLDLDLPAATIRKLVGGNAAALLELPADAAAPGGRAAEPEHAARR